MPIYSCGFNEFSQVSSATNDQKRGFVSLPVVIDLQSNIGTHEYSCISFGSDYTDERLYSGRNITDEGTQPRPSTS